MTEAIGYNGKQKRSVPEHPQACPTEVHGCNQESREAEPQPGIYHIPETQRIEASMVRRDY
jgi:hypothetical protein